MTTNMTEGNSVKLILKFALPLLIGNLLQQTYNIIDAAIVGRILGTGALASVGASSSVQFLVLGFCIGICCGFGIPIATSFGASDHERLRRYMFHAMVLTGIVAVILTVTCALLCGKILHLLSTPQDIYTGAYQYLLVLFLGMPFTLLYNLLSGILRAVGDSRTPFIFLAISTVLNIALDLFCILVLQWGCMGAAIATITAQAVSGILCALFMWSHFPNLRLGHADCELRGDYIKTLLVMGVPMGLQYSITAIGSMVMQSANNGLGSIYVSAFTAAARIKQFLMCPFDAIATAVSVFCGQNLGAGKIERIKRGLSEGVGIGVTYGALTGLLMIFTGRTLAMIFVNQSSVEVLDATGRYLRCIGCFFWSLGILNICRMSTQGIGFSGRVIFSGIAEMIARIFVSFVFVPIYKFGAICWADQTAWIAACFYIVPTCIWCIRKIERNISAQTTT